MAAEDIHTIPGMRRNDNDSDIETIDFTFCGAPEGQLEAACRNDPIHLALR